MMSVSSTPSSDHPRDLKRKTATSIVWTIARGASDQLFSFIVFVTMARLLPKHDIGVFAIAYIFAEVGRAIAANAVNQVIARQPQLSERFMNTVFWTNVAVATLYAAIIVLLVLLPIPYFQQPGLRPVLMAMAIPVIVNALGSTHLALRLREFGHKTIAIRSVVAGLIGGSVAIAAAFLGFGVWSLVIQRVVNEVIGTVLSWLSYRWRPSLQYDVTIAKQNIGFSGDLTIAQLIFLFLVRIQDLIVGGVLGPAMVAVYRVSWRLIESFAVGSIQPFSTVALQTFSRLADRPTELRNAYRQFIRLCSSVSFPAVVGLGVLSPELVHVVYGAKWVEAGRLGQVFAFMAVPFTLNYFASPVLSAMGDGRKQRLLALIQLVLTIVLTASVVRYGLLWVVVGYVLRSYLTLPIQIRFLERSSGIRLSDTWSAIKWPFFCSVAMGLAVTALKLLVELPPFWMLVSGAALGGILYVAALTTACPELIRQISDFLRKRRPAENVE